MKTPRRTALFFLLLTAPILACAIQASYIDVNAVVTNSPAPQVTFSWDTQASWATIEVARREMGVTGNAPWEARGTVSYPTTAFTDAVAPGTTYEYRVRRPYQTSYNTYQAVAAYVAVSLEAPLVERRGGLLLVVDNTVTNALAQELRLLEMDLAGDGWNVQRLAFAREGTATPPELREAITNAYLASGGTLKAVYLFGHLPVAKSGYIAPDGHSPLPQHTDGFYGDVDGTWTDTTYNVAGVNIPGDGIYDPNYFYNAVELGVGRTDFAGMSAFHKQEIEYLRDYIHKSHAFRHGRRTEIPRRGLWNSGYLWPERNWINPLFGTANVTYAAFQPTLATDPYLFGIDFGYWDGGDALYTETPNKLIFAINFGSHKLYWNNGNNAMRALLTQPDWGLTCAWGARPSWFFHHMGAGLPVGYSALRTMNNLSGSDYTPNGTYSYMAGYVGVALMGDPTLRLHPVAAPQGVSAVKQGGSVVLNWQASPDPVVSGYHVYRSTAPLGPYTRLTSSPVAALAYTHDTPPTGEAYYQVRALKREITSAAIYTNASQGVFVHLNADDTANRAPTANGTNGATSAEQFLSIPLTGTDADGDPLTPIVTRNPAHGELRWNGLQAVYVPKAGYAGADSLAFVMYDGVAVSSPTTVAIEVNPDHNILEWEFGSPYNGEWQTRGSSTNAPGILPTTLTMGSALILRNSNYLYQDDALHFDSAPVGGLNPNGYIQWRVVPTPDMEASLERVSVGLWNLDSTRPLNAELRWSDDGFATWQTAALGANQVRFDGFGYAPNRGMPFAADLSAFPALQGTTNAVMFRLFLWHDVSSTACGIGKLGASSIDLAVSGTLAPFEFEPPVITSPLAATGTVGAAFAYAITALNAPTGFAATGLPAGLTLDGTTGLISGVPVEALQSTVTLSATNALGSATRELALSIGCIITASATDGGNITPSGILTFGGGDMQAFEIAAGPYATLSDVHVDGISIGSIADYTFENVRTNHTIHAVFSAFVTSHGTPYWWLAERGWTSDFETADLADPDGDGVPNYAEHQAETDPTDPLSRPLYNAVPYAESFENLAGWGGVYTNVAGRMGWQSGEPQTDTSQIVRLDFHFAATNPPLPSTTHTNVLQLKTEGTVLSTAFGAGSCMTGALVYVDMLTQLVPSEDVSRKCTPQDSGVKVGLFLDSDNRLCVYHGVAAADGVWVGNTVTTTDRVLNPDNWYRLTYALDSTLGEGAPAMFQVRVDGVEVTNSAAFGKDWKSQYAATGTLPAPSPDGSWFHFATADAAATRMRKLSFSGTGFVDDLRVSEAEPFTEETQTYLLIVNRIGLGRSSLGTAAFTAVPVPAGVSTQIVYRADDWHRIAALDADGAAIHTASGLAVYTQFLGQVSATVSNAVVFAPATPSQTGYGVPTSWLENWTEAAVAQAPADGFDVETKFMLGLDPTVSNTYHLAMDGLTANGSEVVIVVRRDVTGSLSPDGMHGLLGLQHTEDLRAGFTNMPETSATGADVFDATGRRAFTNDLGTLPGFFRAVVQPPLN